MVTGRLLDAKQLGADELKEIKRLIRVAERKERS